MLLELFVTRNFAHWEKKGSNVTKKKGYFCLTVDSKAHTHTHKKEKYFLNKEVRPVPLFFWSLIPSLPSRMAKEPFSLSNKQLAKAGIQCHVPLISTKLSAPAAFFFYQLLFLVKSGSNTRWKKHPRCPANHQSCFFPCCFSVAHPPGLSNLLTNTPLPFSTLFPEYRFHLIRNSMCQSDLLGPCCLRLYHCADRGNLPSSNKQCLLPYISLPVKELKNTSQTQQRDFWKLVFNNL